MADSTEQVTTTETPVTPTEPATEPSTLTAEAVSQMIAEAFQGFEQRQSEAKKLSEMTDQQRAETERDSYKQQLHALQKQVEAGNAIRKRHSFAGFSSSGCGCRGRKDHQNTGGSLCNAVYRSGRKRRQGTPQRRTTLDRSVRTHDERTDFRHS